MNRFSQCNDCAFNHIEPAICDECLEANQFVEEVTDDAGDDIPLYFRPWERKS